jgi:hypothetical protein
MTHQTELLPCRDCEGIGIMEHCMTGYSVYCSKCLWQTYCYKNKNKAIEEFNTRHQRKV